ncbi:MAG: MarR family transcriptional regulator, partial [Planctomycetes bacterium]|nr:MarR family transcriptional regulator [Planctomycetota bacterium]
HSYGITGPQLVCLKTLIDEGPMSLTTLARRVHVGGSTITGIIDRLVAKGLVLRVQDAGDRRRSVVSATKKASGFVSKAPSPLQETFATRLAKLPELEQAAIAMSLQRIVHLMEAEDIDAAPILHGSERLADDPA